VQTICVAVDNFTLQLIPSTVIVGVPTSRYKPVNVISYPPNTSPLSGVTPVIIGE